MRMTNAPEKVEVITSVQRRRRWRAAEKMRMVEESLEPSASVSLVARRHASITRSGAFRRGLHRRTAGGAPVRRSMTSRQALQLWRSSRG